MDGRPVGISLTSALASPSLSGLDQVVAEFLMSSIEQGALAGMAEAEKES